MNRSSRVVSPTVSVVMPVHDARRYLEQSLGALLRTDDPQLLEVIVVDDGSSDGSGELGAELGARVLRSDGRRGPAAARNRGAEEAQGDLLLFVDADVVVHPDSLARIAQGFERPEVVAVFGSYDAAPPYPGFASRYMNLRHHHGHRIPSSDADTFWAGLGAVRRDAFRAVGGFDARRFPWPSVEDIELGYRLRRAGGRIRRDPSIQATHLKRWSFGEVIRTDLLRRAIPWFQLMLEHPGAFTDLNLQRAERWKVGLAGALTVAILLALAGWLSPWVPAALFAGAWLVNRSLFALFLRTNGWWFALRALLLHQLHYLYSGAAYALCVLHWHASRARARDPDSGGRDSSE